MERRLTVSIPRSFSSEDREQKLRPQFAARNYELHPGVEQGFEIIDGDRDVKHLIRYLENRASQKHPDAVCTITHAGSNEAEFHCAFCGETLSIPFYPNGQTTPRLVVRWHFHKCHGVVGHETITVETIDSRGVQPPNRFTVDLTVSMREIDPQQ